MFCKARTRALVVGLTALAVALCAPPAAFGSDAQAELLAPGAGYANPGGSEPVRQVQRLLRRLGNSPGPIDGLYGPLTTAAVQRFQEAHRVAVDGVVGPVTMGRLAGERRKLRRAELERKSPAPSTRAESVTERAPARSPATPPRAQPEPESSTGPAPELAAAVAGLALILLLVVVWRLARRHRPRPRGQPAGGLRLGLVCAALLAAYAIGAATGALFASEARPDRDAKPSTATAEPRLR
jgi:hypothetical protein